MDFTPPPPYGYTPAGPYVPPAAPRKSRRGVVIGVSIFLALLACVVGTVVVAATNAPTARTPQFVGAARPGTFASDPAPAATVAAGVLTKSDVALTLKITKKDCFGSAGCNVQYKIAAAISDTGRTVLARSDGWSLTYEVSGFDDGTQIGTLELDTAGAYTQDSYLAGSTAGQPHLKITVTDLDAK